MINPCPVILYGNHGDEYGRCKVKATTHMTHYIDSFGWDDTYAYDDLTRENSVHLRDWLTKNHRIVRVASDETDKEREDDDF